MKSKLSSLHFAALSSALPVALVLSTIMACGAPDRSGPSSATGGTTNNGGQTGSSNTSSGGATQAGGVTSGGGTTASGGTTTSGGATASGGAGGSTGRGGTTGPGGSTSSGGATASGGAGGSTGRGGTTGPGGSTSSGGATAHGGAAGSGGAAASGGATGSAGSTGTRPCDIYEAAGYPCVAAHSMVRALYAAYTGPLYQVRKGGNTKDIPVGTDGYVTISEQDSFCSGGGCTISVLYDQSPNKNDLAKTPATTWITNSKEANATDGKVTVNGHTAYGIYINANQMVGYRNNSCSGVAKNDDPEAMYMVLDGKRYTSLCCFDYGNVSSTGKADGPGTMEAIYWGSSTQFSKAGAGTGPWVEADLEYGMFACDTPSTVCATNTTVTGMAYVTAMLKGPSGNSFGLKAGNAQSGKLETKWNGNRPAGGYAPKKLGGQIVLGTGGDGSGSGSGTFWEGAMTKGNPPDSVDDAIQANIVAAGYGQ